jgi:hypothetical protein
MPTLLETFQDYETNLLEMVAEQWGIVDDINLSKNVKKQLANLLVDKALFTEIFQSLPTKAQMALMQINSAGGMIPAAQFMRALGEIREMGAGARGKERPDRNPANVTETLFYKGLIAISFFNKNRSAEEYVYIPQEFMTFLKPLQEKTVRTPTPPKYPVKSIKKIIPASDEIIDHMCSYLAALRGNVPVDETILIIPPAIQRFLLAFFLSQGITNQAGAIINIEKLKEILLEGKDSAFSKVCLSWIKSPSINELKLLPNLIFEGKWKNDPAKTRNNFLKVISNLQPDTWYAIPDFLNWMHHVHPDFQRSRGEYDLWFIKDARTERFVNGFENWHEVEGKLLEYFIVGPLSWMGLVELGRDEKKGDPTAFKMSKWASSFLNKQAVAYETPETSEFVLQTNGMVLVPTHTQREIRYQIARYCVWVDKLPDFYRYKLCAKAFRRANAQNLTPDQIKTLIEKYGKKPIPSNILTAIDRWQKQQTQIEIKDQKLIHTASAEILDAIHNSPADKYMIERLNDTAAIVSAKNLHRLEEELVKMGYFSEICPDV